MNAIEKRHERAALVREMVELSQSNDANSVARWKQLDSQQESLRVQIEQTERSSALNTEMDTIRNTERPRLGNEDDTRALSPSEQVRSTPEYRKAFETLIRTGKESYETRALSSTGDGQTLIPIGFEKELVIKLKSYSGMRQACRILRTQTGNPLTWPTLDDTGVVGEILPESSGVNGAEPTFSSVTLGSSLISSKQVIVPIQLLQDQEVDLESVLNDAFGIRIGRAMEAAYTTGTGTIAGILPALVAATGRSVTAVGANSNSNNAGDTDLTSVGTDDLGNLVSKLDPAYRTSKACGFMANSTTWDKLRRQQDRYGRPLWSVSVAAGEPDKCWGFPYFYNQNMASIGAGNISMLYGDFNKYIVRDSLGVTLAIQRELYITNHQIGFLAFARTDGKLLDPAAFTYLIHPAS